MTGLRIAPGLELDPDYVGGGAFAVLAKRGAGKTYTGRVMAEEMWTASVPFVVLDPMGAWWGLRAEGNRPGMPIPIFGGEHADAPLERTGGSVMADLIVDEGLSAILDLSAFGTRAAERQFALDFLSRLYRKNRSLLHVFVDEADLFAPQRPAPGDQPLLGAAENIVRRGRNRGLGSTWFTQRPAVLNKDVLTQMDGLVAMRITGLTDREVIDAWVRGHGDPELAAKVKPTLAGLGTGECWWWIPELDVLERVQVRRTRTFDSSPTRTRGEKRQAPKGIADIDVPAIADRMAETIERAKEQDPKELQRRIRMLEKQLADRPVPEPLPAEKVLVLSDQDRGQLEAWVSDIGLAAGQLQHVAEHIAAAVASVPPASQRVPPISEKTLEKLPALAPTQIEWEEHQLVRGSREPDVPTMNGAVTAPQSRILNALAFLADQLAIRQPSRLQLALFSHNSPKAGGFANNLGAMRSAGLIDYPATGLVELTADGRRAAHGSVPVASQADLNEYLAKLVGGAKSRILAQLMAVYPHECSRENLAANIGISPNGGGYANNLGALRSLGLIEYPQQGTVRALPVLFLEG